MTTPSTSSGVSEVSLQSLEQQRPGVMKEPSGRTALHCTALHRTAPQATGALRNNTRRPGGDPLRCEPDLTSDLPSQPPEM